MEAAYRAVVGEIFLPFRTATPKPMTEARSTLIVSGIQTLRASADGLYERYVELLSPKLRQDIMSLVAGLWIPGELALEHYRTMDRLQLSKSTIEAIGAEVAERGAKTVLLREGAPGKATRRPGTCSAMSHRNLDINWRGSDMMISKEGPQEALFLWAGQPCASVPYFVTSWGSFLRAVVTSGVARRRLTASCTISARRRPSSFISRGFEILRRPRRRRADPLPSARVMAWRACAASSSCGSRPPSQAGPSRWPRSGPACGSPGPP